MALHPVGPLPASTYWRRRAVLLVAALVVLLAARSCLGGSPKSSGHSTSTVKPKATGSPHPAATTLPPVASGGPCPDSSLTLTSKTDADTYALGSAPRITLTVTNSGTVPCTRDLGSGAVELLVYSGPSDRIWSSDDCQSAKGTAVATLQPGGHQNVVVTWFAKRSAPGCTGTREAAKAGTYRLELRVGTLRTQGAVFRLHG